MVFVFEMCWFVTDYYIVIAEKTLYFCGGGLDCNICFGFVGTIKHTSERVVLEVTSWQIADHCCDEFLNIAQAKSP